MWNRASVIIQASGACLVLVLTVLACGGGGVTTGGFDTGPDNGRKGGGGITTARSAGPILFLSDMPGICNGGPDGYTCERSCATAPIAEGFTVGNDGDEPLSWSATIAPAHLHLSVASGLVAPHTRLGQRVEVVPGSSSSYHISVTAAGRTVPIDVNCS